MRRRLQTIDAKLTIADLYRPLLNRHRQKFLANCLLACAIITFGFDGRETFESLKDMCRIAPSTIRRNSVESSLVKDGTSRWP